jgi:hypothetical protein
MDHTSCSVYFIHKCYWFLDNWTKNTMLYISKFLYSTTTLVSWWHLDFFSLFICASFPSAIMDNKSALCVHVPTYSFLSVGNINWTERKSIRQNSWGANNNSATQEIPHLLWDLLLPKIFILYNMKKRKISSCYSGIMNLTDYFYGFHGHP